MIGISGYWFGIFYVLYLMLGIKVRIIYVFWVSLLKKIEERLKGIGFSCMEIF